MGLSLTQHACRQTLTFLEFFCRHKLDFFLPICTSGREWVAIPLGYLSKRERKREEGVNAVEREEKEKNERNKSFETSWRWTRGSSSFAVPRRGNKRIYYSPLASMRLYTHTRLAIENLHRDVYLKTYRFEYLLDN